MQRPPATVVVLGTGGTIAGTAASPDDNVGYVAGTWASTRSWPRLPGLRACAVETEQVAQLDSKDMDFAIWRAPGAAAAPTTWRGPRWPAWSSPTAPTRWRRRPTSCSARWRRAKPVVLTAAMRPATSRAGRRAAEPARRGGGRARRPAPAACVVAFAGALHGPRSAQGPSVAARRVRVRRCRAARRGRGGRCRSAARGRRSPRSVSTICRRRASLAVGRDRHQPRRRRWPRRAMRWSTRASTASSSRPPATASSIASSPRRSSRRRPARSRCCARRAASTAAWRRRPAAALPRPATLTPARRGSS